MQAILKFNLPEEENEFKVATRALDYFGILFDLDQEMRKFLKYGHKFKTVEEVIEYVREIINEVKLDDIE